MFSIIKSFLNTFIKGGDKLKDKKWVEIIASYDGERGYLVRKTESFRVKDIDDVIKLVKENNVTITIYSNSKFLSGENGVKL